MASRRSRAKEKRAFLASMFSSAHWPADAATAGCPGSAKWKKATVPQPERPQRVESGHSLERSYPAATADLGRSCRMARTTFPASTAAGVAQLWGYGSANSPISSSAIPGRPRARMNAIVISPSSCDPRRSHPIGRASCCTPSSRAGWTRASSRLACAPASAETCRDSLPFVSPEPLPSENACSTINRPFRRQS